MSNRDPKLYLEDIATSIQKIEEYTKDISLNEFIQDMKTIDAVVRNTMEDGQRGFANFKKTNF